MSKIFSTNTSLEKYGWVIKCESPPCEAGLLVRSDYGMSNTLPHIRISFNCQVRGVRTPNFFCSKLIQKATLPPINEKTRFEPGIMLRIWKIVPYSLAALHFSRKETV